MTNILIVDDEKVVRDLLKRLFLSDGTNMFTAESGAQALEIAKKNKIDIALIDIRMPGLDGLRTYQELSYIQPNLACIFITGYALEEAFFDKTKKPGMICLKKPFDDIRQLKELVNQVLKESDAAVPVLKETPKEKRAYVRLNITLEVNYKIKNEEGKFISTVSQNIAPGGIKILTQEKLPPGMLLDLVIKSNVDERRCRAEGRVIWSKEAEGRASHYFVGIKFTNINLSELARIIIDSDSADK
ncbi:response regulator [bacterium]|nr:MAG: response regulator [bacterium]